LKGLILRCIIKIQGYGLRKSITAYFWGKFLNLLIKANFYGYRFTV